MKYLVASLALVACGSSDPVKMDAAKMDGTGSGSASTLVDVDCATNTAALTVTTTDLNMTSYTLAPANGMINMGQVVKFQMSTMHDVKPNPIAPHTDSGLSVPFGGTKCKRFTATGTFGFLCSAHSFVATVTVN